MSSTQAPVSGQLLSIQPVCIVTGGSRGIGRAICETLADQGYDICVNYTSEASQALAEAVVADAKGKGRKAFSCRADVSNPEQVERLFDQAEAQLGQVTALVNNAAIIGPRNSLLDTSLEDLQRTMEINVHGPFNTTKAFVKRALKAGLPSGLGAIVNVSSGSAFIGRPLAYSMSKGALNSFSAGCVAELAGYGIRLNSVSPGLTKTDMVTDKVITENLGAIPMKRAAEPREIANVIAFLLSDAASYVSGGNLRVAGGRRMGSGAQ